MRLWTLAGFALVRGRGLKRPTTPPPGGDVVRFRPRTGAWIETIDGVDYTTCDGWFRPRTGAWIETTCPGRRDLRDQGGFALVRGRGLKRPENQEEILRLAQFRPRTGAWIETISSASPLSMKSRFRPRTGAWIETCGTRNCSGGWHCFALVRGRGLKHGLHQAATV